MTTLDLTPAANQPLVGTMTVPGDKSISHRALMIGAIATGTTTISNFLIAEDTLSTLAALQDLGVPITRTNTAVTITGVGLHGMHPSAHPLAMNNSGTTTYLLSGILAGQNFATTLTGDDSLSTRPMDRVVTPLTQMGARVATTDRRLPLTITGGTLHGIDYQMPIAAAQPKSAFILAGLYADTPTTVHELIPTRDHTEIMLRQFGADVVTSADRLDITVTPGRQLTGQAVTVPGDISSAAFFITAAALIPGSHLRIENVGLNAGRTKLLTVLTQMGAAITVDAVPGATEPVGTVTIDYAPLHGVDVTAASVPGMIDELPLLALLGARAQGTTTIHGAADLRNKETDRIAVTSAELAKFGVVVAPSADGFSVTGPQAIVTPSVAVDSHGDHRMGMLLALAALLAPGASHLERAAAVAVSYPDFFTHLAALRSGGQA